MSFIRDRSGWKEVLEVLCLSARGGDWGLGIRGSGRFHPPVGHTGMLFLFGLRIAIPSGPQEGGIEVLQGYAEEKA